MKIYDENLFSENVALGSMKFKKIIYNISLCKSWCDVKQQEMKELVGRLALSSFIRSSFKTWNTMYQKTCIFHLILLGIPSSLVLPVKNRKVGGGGLLKGKNPLSVTKVICWRSLKEKIVQTLIEIKNK